MRIFTNLNRDSANGFLSSYQLLTGTVVKVTVPDTRGTSVQKALLFLLSPSRIPSIPPTVARSLRFRYHKGNASGISRCYIHREPVFRREHGLPARGVDQGERPHALRAYRSRRRRTRGWPLMVATPLLALDLPLKILVWQDAEQKVWLSYNTPAYLAQRHTIPADLTNNIAGIEALAKAAVA